MSDGIALNCWKCDQSVSAVGAGGRCAACGGFDAEHTVGEHLSKEAAHLESLIRRERDKRIDPTTVLDEAAQATSQDRNTDYGHPRDNLENTARLWSAYLSRSMRAEVTIEPRDVCNMMVLVKVSRDANAPKRDNLVDIAGWARCAEMLEEPQDGGPPVMPPKPMP